MVTEKKGLEDYKVSTGFALPLGLKIRLKVKSSELGVSQSKVVADAIVTYLDGLDALERAIDETTGE